MANEAFKFPDEKGDAAEQQNKVEFDVEGDVDLEVVDDTPEQDRGRKPLETEPDEVTDAELAQYSKDVQSRIKSLTHARHDERRRKEEVQREREELERAARALAAENQRLKQYVQTGEQAYAGTLKEAAESAVETAKRKYKEAHEAFDTDALIEAQQELTTAQLRLAQAANFRPSSLQAESNEVQREPTAQAPTPDAKTLRWQQRNQWFGQDEEMTAVALVLHKQLVNSGSDPRSDEYFNSIDTKMRKRFPDFFEDDAPEPSQQRRSQSVVAPASRSTGAKKITLTKTQVAVAKRLGVPLEAYAKQIAMQEAANG